MKKDIRMIGLDLDGTLLNDQKEITPYTKAVLEEATRQGVFVLIATGRPYDAILKELEDFPKSRYALTSNGARIMDLEKGVAIIENTLPVEKAIEAIDAILDFDVVYEAFMEGKGYTIEDRLMKIEDYFGEPGMADYMRRTRIPTKDVRAKIRELGLGVEKVHLIFKSLDERKEARKRLEQIEGVVISGAFTNTLEVNLEGTSKANGLLALGALHGITREQIMACGDGMNDYEMVRRMGFGVAMANGNPKVKEIADYVTVSNNEDGVAKAIEKFVLR